MKKMILVVALATSLLANDIIVKESQCSVDKTVDNLKKIMQAKGLSVFATIDHQANAKAISMKMRPAKLLIFGNPKLGTALMKQDIQMGLDLPLKILVYKDEDSKVKFAYRDGSWLAKNHTLNAPKKIAKINGAMDKITTKAGLCKKD
ncbi:MAG: hypothetical protein ACJAWW_000612 [Sulfurimonas sp.]|jgi:uncharacterized protein (DUF302 family)